MIVKNTDEHIKKVRTDCTWNDDKRGVIITTDGRESQDVKIEYRIPIFSTLEEEDGELSSVQTDYVLHTEDGTERVFGSESIHVPRKVFDKAKQVTGLEWTDNWMSK